MVADPNDLADRLIEDREVIDHTVQTYDHVMPLIRREALYGVMDDLNTAAALLRQQADQLDTLCAAIGDPSDIEWLASACLDEAMACQQIGGFGETVGVLSQAAVALQRVAAAGGGVPEEGATDE